MSQTLNYLPDVKQQYEDYPYPKRDPEHEKVKLFNTATDFLDRINYYGFGGKRNFHKDFRVLIAGGGTGDAAVFLGEQLRDTDAEIIYVDLSSASMEIAKERAKVRELDNIQWHLASLLDVSELSIGTFDYINCTGVLHHLKDPDAGLAALKSVLKEDGVIGIMLYAQHARTAIYQMQEMLQLISGDEPIDQRIEDCKTILNRLPKTNWYSHCHEWYNDVSLFSDTGIYDLFLHSQDRAYTIPELYDYVEKQGLTLLHLIHSYNYKIAPHIHDTKLMEKINRKDEKIRYAIGELLNGNVIKHMCHISRQRQAPPSTDDLDMVPHLAINAEHQVYDKIRQSAEQEKGNFITFTHTPGTALVPRSSELTACLQHMDGHNSLEEIYEKVSETHKFERSVLQNTFSYFLNTLISLDLLYLRHKDVPAYRTIQQINEDMEQRK